MNPQLPSTPGKHGIVFDKIDTYNDGSPIKQHLNFFVRGGSDAWVYLGTYSYPFSGEISTTHVSLLPTTFLSAWIGSAVKNRWGENWVNKTNANIKETAKACEVAPVLVTYTADGIYEAIMDGRLVITFSVMRCVGYNEDWYKRLLAAEANPKPNRKNAVKTESTRELGLDQSVRNAIGRSRRVTKKAKVEDDRVDNESDSQDEEGWNDDDSAYGARQGDEDSQDGESYIAPARIGTRSSGRIGAQRYVRPQ